MCFKCGHVNTSLLPNQDQEPDPSLRATLQEDLWSTMRGNQGAPLSKDAFQELLGSYRDQENGRRKLRDAENEQHKASFLKKMAMRSKNAKVCMIQYFWAFSRKMDTLILGLYIGEMNMKWW